MDLSSISWEMLGQPVPLSIAVALFMQLFGKSFLDMAREWILRLIALIRKVPAEISEVWPRRGFWYNLGAFGFALLTAWVFRESQHPPLQVIWLALQATGLAIGAYEVVSNTARLGNTGEADALVIEAIVQETLAGLAPSEQLLSMRERLAKSLKYYLRDIKWR